MAAGVVSVYLNILLSHVDGILVRAPDVMKQRIYSLS
jgi:hypothetical protein